MAGRALAFSDAEILRMAREDFVAVAADDWYQRRRQDAEGRFFISVAEQGPRKGAGGSTRQGIYALTASGKLLAYKNAGQNPDVMREVITDARRKWKALPESERKPGAVQVGDAGATDPQFTRTPPAKGLILNAFARLLDREADGRFKDASGDTGRGDEASRDHLWITEAEWKSLVPAAPRVGEKFPLPERIAARLARFHLVDHTRGEPNFWSAEDVRTSRLSLVVEEAGAKTMKLRLEGNVLLSTDADTAKAQRGYDARVRGLLEFDRERKAFTRFDIVAVGDHWGRGVHTGPARSGRTPLGLAFELTDGKSPADRVAPQAARDSNAYFNATVRN